MSRLMSRAVLLTLLAALFVPAVASAQSGPYAELPGPISAFPLPGTQTAGTGTQISLRGAPLKRLGRITVTGSKSGRHSGRLRAHSDGQGASFVLKRRLSQGSGSPCGPISRSAARATATTRSRRRGCPSG